MRFPLLPVLLGAVLVQQPVAAQTRLEPLNDLSSHQVDTQQLRSALSSRTLTWLTGTSANNDYISVGRLANFFGFVALRVSSGHSLTRAMSRATRWPCSTTPSAPPSPGSSGSRNRRMRKPLPRGRR